MTHECLVTLRAMNRHMRSRAPEPSKERRTSERIAAITAVTGLIAAVGKLISVLLNAL